MGGQGGGAARTETELRQIVSEGLAASPINQVLVEESVLGWGEFELELMRDRNDNVIVVCSIENIDPMGVHTGDSVTVAPAQTLSDALYQELRDQAITVIRAVGVETGGSNVQFGVDPESGEIVVIEMNPRVSRSSALASKATGFPIAKIAARLAVGYTLDEIPNDITRATPAAFEPTIDYVVTKMPRFAFEKFPGSEGAPDDPHEVGRRGDGDRPDVPRVVREGDALARARRSGRPPRGRRASCSTGSRRPSSDRFDLVLEALPPRRRASSELHARTAIDHWYLRELEKLATEGDGTDGPRAHLQVRRHLRRRVRGARRPYFYSAHERPASGPIALGEVRRGDRPSVVILGSGPEPDRPGDRVRLLLRPRRDDRPRVRPRRGDDQLQPGDGLDRLRHLRPALLRAAHRRGRARGDRAGAARGRDRPVRRPDAAAARARSSRRPGVKLLGTPVDAIDLAEDRGRFGALLERLGIAHPPYGTALSAEEARVDRRAGRLPAARPALLRARRPGDGDLLLDRGPRRPT